MDAIPSCEIRLQAPEAVTLGASLVLQVVYANREKAAVTLREPARTWEVMLDAHRPGEEPALRQLGRILVSRSGGMTRQVLEPADDVHLEPGGEHAFTVDVWARWPELLRPGPLLLRIVDLRNDAKTDLSNAVRVQVRFDETSVEALLSLLARHDSTYESREVAQRLLAQVQPGFHLPLVLEEEAQRAESDAAVAAFRTFWQGHREDPQVKAALARLDGRPEAPDAGPGTGPQAP